jgi:hypothetical protein
MLTGSADSGVVSDGDGEAYESGNDSPWTRRYANNDAEAFLEEVSEPDEYETESDDLSTPPPETHPRHRAGRAGTPWRKLDKAPSSEELHTAPRGKTRGLSPGHESWSINYISAELLQLIVDQLGPDALFPPTENRLLPGGPYVGHPAPKDVYQQRRVFDLFRWRSWFLGLRQLSKRFASAGQSRPQPARPSTNARDPRSVSVELVVDDVHPARLPDGSGQSARLAVPAGAPRAEAHVLRRVLGSRPVHPEQRLHVQAGLVSAVRSSLVSALRLSAVQHPLARNSAGAQSSRPPAQQQQLIQRHAQMCPMHARLCTAPGPRKWLSWYVVCCLECPPLLMRKFRSHDCLLIETDSRGMSICFDHIAFPLSKKMDANLCSDCRQDQLELQLMSKSVPASVRSPRRVLTLLGGRYGQRPLNQTAYCESLEVYAYMWEGARTAVYAARKAMEHVRLRHLLEGDASDACSLAVLALEPLALQALARRRH